MTQTFAFALSLLPALAVLTATPAQAAADRPNILWIIGEDASAHLSCYGETAIQTPVLDRLAAEGVRFTNAFTTCPVCSPCRTALITGMYQATLGGHNHRCQQTGRKGGGNTAYYNSYELPGTVPFLPRLFKEAGYFTTLGDRPDCSNVGKTDYNFIFDPSDYDAADWRFCPSDKPFFAQITLMGGKLFRTTGHHHTNADDVRQPPYYPDHPDLLSYWAAYLNTWIEMDQQVGQILRDLRDAGVLDNTVVFFFTDHGLTHVRGKQFLYNEGIHIPLIVRFPARLEAGSVRDDLVMQMDIAATSLALAGIPVPAGMHGRDFFSHDYAERDYVVCARDRCDETVDIIRCVRTKRFKYIRNFMLFMSHTQPNDSKDHKAVIQTMRALYHEGKLDLVQSQPFQPTRPAEELYDLAADPHEMVNLAGNPRYQQELAKFRQQLITHMLETGDLGLIPEPILEDWGRKLDNKLNVLKRPEHEHLIPDLIGLFQAGELGQREELLSALVSTNAAMRYWATTWLGLIGDGSIADEVTAMLVDEEPAVRIAAALALHRLGQTTQGLELLREETRNFNLLNSLYALRALEIIGQEAMPVRDAISAARLSPYEYTRRIAERLYERLH